MLLFQLEDFELVPLGTEGSALTTARSLLATPRNPATGARWSGTRRDQAQPPIPNSKEDSITWDVDLVAQVTNYLETKPSLLPGW